MPFSFIETSTEFAQRVWPRLENGERGVERITRVHVDNEGGRMTTFAYYFHPVLPKHLRGRYSVVVVVADDDWPFRAAQESPAPVGRSTVDQVDTWVDSFLLSFVCLIVCLDAVRSLWLQLMCGSLFVCLFASSFLSSFLV